MEVPHGHGCHAATGAPLTKATARFVATGVAPAIARRYRRLIMPCHFSIRALLLAPLLAAAGVQAGPWAETGDARMVADVELLKAFGHIPGPVNAWPLPWAQIEVGIESARADPAASMALTAARRRLEILADRNRQSSRYFVRAAFTNDAALVRGQGETARNPVDLTATASHDLGDAVSITWGGSYLSDGSPGQVATERGNGFSPAPSHATVRLGNWALYGGWVETQWGPGHDGSLLFSNSARAFPKVGIRRLRPYSIDAPVLRWLGPVSADFFVGMADEDREFDNPAIVGMRFAFQPTPYFEMGLKRGLMLCGSGRPCGLEIWARSFAGLGDFDNTGTPDEPGNQLAGFDMAYRRPIGKTGHALLLTFDTIAEDADNILIEQFARQIGMAFTGPVGTGGAMYRAGLEYTDTQGSLLMSPLRIGWKTARLNFPGSVYNNFIYQDGWTYGGRPLGYSLDGDTRAVTLHGQMIDTENRRWYGSLRSIDMNIYEFPTYRISQNRERIAIATAGVDWPTRFGDLRLEARVQDNAPNTPDSRPTRLQAEVAWTSRF